MNRIKKILTVAGLTLSIGMAADRPFQDIMKSAFAANGATNKALAAKDEAKAAAEATKLKAEFKAMEKYWAKAGKPEAAALAKKGTAAANDITKALKKKDAAKAGDAFKAVGATCKPCHEGYREKGADGKFLNKIKA